jgi:hypothetical protein
MEVTYKLRADEISPELTETIQRLFGRNEIIITVSGEADEVARISRENPLRPGEFSDRIQGMRPPEQRQ